MSDKVNELLKSLSDEEIQEFLRKVPVHVNIRASVTAGFFGKAWGKVKVTVTHKDSVVIHKEQPL
jgi:hypothetical protein